MKHTSAGSGCVKRCKNGWETVGQQCFYWSNSIESWDNAEQRCTHKGANLASVPSQSINLYILRKWNERGMKGNDALWIGGTDKVQEGVWKWSDGGVLNFTYWGRGGRNPTGQGDCLQYFREEWWDWKCHEKYHFACSQRICSGEKMPDH